MKQIRFRKLTSVPAVLPPDYVAFVLENGVASIHVADETGTNVHAIGVSGGAGPTGAPGADGTDGADGATGPAGTPGTNGTDGLAGADGDDGADGADHSSYTENVTTAATTWNIAHSLSRYPSVTLVTTGGVVIDDATVTYVDDNNITAVHPTAVDGKAYCN